MHGLEVPWCSWMTAIDERDDVIERWPEWMLTTKTEDYLLLAPGADRTGRAMLSNQPAPWPALPTPLRVPFAEHLHLP